MFRFFKARKVKKAMWLARERRLYPPFDSMPEGFDDLLPAMTNNSYLTDRELEDKNILRCWREWFEMHGVSGGYRVLKKSGSFATLGIE